MKTIKQFVPLIIWLLYSVYTLLYLFLTDYTFLVNHYINLGLLAICFIVFLFSRPAGQLATLILFIIGMFAQAAFTPNIYWFGIGLIKLNWTFLILILSYVLINYKYIPLWFNKVFEES